MIELYFSVFIVKYIAISYITIIMQVREVCMCNILVIIVNANVITLRMMSDIRGKFLTFFLRSMIVMFNLIFFLGGFL